MTTGGRWPTRDRGQSTRPVLRPRGACLLVPRLGLPRAAPHSIYAYYARAFSVPMLRQLYEQLIQAHAIDAIVIVNGGSDSLMAGDEEGLGDPIEDAVSVATVASLDPRLLKILVSIGLGTDRYNHVSDAASFARSRN